MGPSDDNIQACGLWFGSVLCCYRVFHSYLVFPGLIYSRRACGMKGQTTSIPRDIIAKMPPTWLVEMSCCK